MGGGGGYYLYKHLYYRSVIPIKYNIKHDSKNKDDILIRLYMKYEESIRKASRQIA